MTFWITGASSGIGRATAVEAARHGHNLILTSRAGDALEETAQLCGEHAKVLPYDLSKTDGLAELADKAWDLFPGGVDVLFCNAGQSQRTLVEDTDEDMIRRIMELNYFSVVLLTKAVLAKMLAAGKKGTLSCTTSINGRFGFPLRCAYSSSKHALYGFFETLAAEYHKKGIRVTIICPGRVNTNISLHALEKGGKEHGKLDAGQAGGISSEKAGRQIYKALMKGKAEKNVGGKELLMLYIKRFFPYICRIIARNVNPY